LPGLVGCIFLATISVAAEEGKPNIPSGSQRILTLEARIKLPDYPWRLAWSPDNETIAVTQYNKGELRLVHLKDHTVGEPVLTHFPGSAPIAWSPRMAYLVAAQRGGIRLFSTADWREVAGVPSPHDGCHSQTETPPAFTTDGAYIWVSCAQHSTHGGYLAAVKLAVPDLQIADRLPLESPDIEKRLSALHDTIKLQGTRVAFSTIIAKYVPSKPGYPEIPSYTLRAFDLNRRSEISAPVDLGQFGWGGGFMIDTPIQSLVAIDEMIAVVRGWSRDYQITTINLATGEKLAALASIRDKSYQGLKDIRIVSNGSLLIGAVSQLRTATGGIYIWDTSSGNLVQRASDEPVAWIELSANERNLAAISRDELLIYRVNMN
jgi:hypothetical protein